MNNSCLKNSKFTSLALMFFCLSFGAAAVPATKPSEAPAPKAEAKKEAPKVAETKAPAEAPAPKVEAKKEEVYEPKKLWGEPEYDAKGALVRVNENSSQTHERKNCVTVRVGGFKLRAPKKEKGRLRVAAWNGPEKYGKEGVKPFRASSYWAKDASGGEMKFNLCGFDLGKKYSFFAHFDKSNTGSISKFLGIPREPYIFSNAKNSGKGAGLKRKGFGPPDYDDTAFIVEKDGQEIVLNF